VYKNRLIANDYIVDMIKNVHKKDVLVKTKDTTEYKRINALLNQNIEGYFYRYSNTNLTKEEKRALNTCETNFNELKKVEGSDSILNLANKAKKSKLLNELKNDLYTLSSIQLTEGERQIARSKKTLNSVELFTQIEIYILIFLGILIQIIVIYSPKQDLD